MVRTILANLLDNAISYTPEGGRLHIDLSCADGAFRLTVANDPGDLEPSHLPHLFERFWRRDPARSGGHSGLGLSLARALAELLGFTLEATLRDDRMLAMVLTGPLNAGPEKIGAK
jgi:signal transduction histidine kinase